MNKIRTKSEKLLKQLVRGINSYITRPKIHFRKVSNEILEHFSFLTWVAKRVFLPIALLYFLIGTIFGVRVIDSLFLGFIIFIYSSFLPDFDFAFKKSNRESPWYKKYIFLFFAPIYLFYLISEEMKSIYTAKPKPFHDFRMMAAYGLFLLVLGLIFYGNPLEIFSLMIFGVLGYFSHLVTDDYFKISKLLKRI